MKPHRAWLLAFAIAALGAVPALRAEDAPAPSAHTRSTRELQQRLERLRQQASALVSALPSAGPAPSVSTSPLPSGSALELPASPAELAKRWAAVAATRHERQARHRAELLGELGRHIENPAALVELQLHAKRLAELGRVEFLAQNARQGAARTQLLARVAKLRTREVERHQKRLAALTGRPRVEPGPSAAPAASRNSEARP